MIFQVGVCICDQDRLSAFRKVLFLPQPSKAHIQRGVRFVLYTYTSGFDSHFGKDKWTSSVVIRA